MLANVENERFFLKAVDDGRLVICDDGTIFNAVTLKLYTKVTKAGHIPVAMKDGRKVRHVLAHRLVYLAKVGPLDPEDHVVHLDGKKSNNAPGNLAKMDDSQTTLHSYALQHEGRKERQSASLRRFYEAHLSTSAKLTPDQIREMRRRHADGESRWKLAREFGLCWKDAAKAISGEHYRAVQAEGAAP